jgi:7-cyano-7-deazaguanine synthase
VTAAVLLSGGMDSTALAAMLDGDFHAISVDYGQRHGRRELEAAAAVAAHYGAPHAIADLSGLRALLGTSSLTSDAIDVPEGHYAAENMAATVVPNRNAILLMVAAGYAQAHGCDRVLTAVHAGDHPVYPDCRPEFVAAADAAARLGTGGAISIVAPFARISKWQIAAIGYGYGAPLHLSWSCYNGGELHCGRCGTCVERAEAFHLAGVPDPTTYADSDFWREQAA